MRKNHYLGGICLITDRESCSLTCVEMTIMALRAGIKCVQLRDKNKDRKGLYRLALMLREITADFGAYCIVNDHADIAASVDADGVHLGQDDLPVSEARRILGKGKIIGVSTHGLIEAIKAENDGADYIGFGPLFMTATKDAGSPKGAAMLREVKSAVKIPVMAIGGIGIDSIQEVFASGADAVATASAVLKGMSEDNARRLISQVANC